MPEPASFRTSRLVFRAVQAPLDDTALLDIFGSDEPGQFGWTDAPVIPYSPKDIENFHKSVEKPAFAVMICLPDEEQEKTEGSGRKAGKSIGMMLLRTIDYVHRKADFGISLHRDHQGKGYAQEALHWLLERAFVGFGLQRIQGRCFSFNERALKSYKSIGFAEEGRLRKSSWIQGSYHDEILIGILASEWFGQRIVTHETVKSGWISKCR